MRGRVASGEVEVYHISIDENPANPLTKAETSSNLQILDESFFYHEKEGNSTNAITGSNNN